MGQKVHPYGLRLGIIRQSKSRWFAEGSRFSKQLVEDLKIRRVIEHRHLNAGIADILIERTGDAITVTIQTAKPGVVIGRGGQDVEILRREIERHTGSRTRVNVEEARDADVNAQLVADNIARQIERRISYRRAMRQAVDRCLRLGGLGIRVKVSGRLSGAEIARSEAVGPEGRVPLHTLRADVEYGVAKAHTQYGNIGVKVWVYKGDIIPDRPGRRIVEAEPEPQLAAEQPTVAETPAAELAPGAVSAPAAAAYVGSVADFAQPTEVFGPPLEADETPIVAAIEPEGEEAS